MVLAAVGMDIVLTWEVVLQHLVQEALHGSVEQLDLDTTDVGPGAGEEVALLQHGPEGTPAWHLDDLHLLVFIFIIDLCQELAASEHDVQAVPARQFVADQAWLRYWARLGLHWVATASFDRWQRRNRLVNKQLVQVHAAVADLAALYVRCVQAIGFRAP